MFKKLNKIRKGDTVKILSGKDKGREGKIIKVFPKALKVTVEGINVYKKHSRPRRQGEKGEIVSVVRPIQASNVILVCPKCSEPTRISKVRVCKKCKAEL